MDWILSDARVESCSAPCISLLLSTQVEKFEMMHSNGAGEEMGTTSVILQLPPPTNNSRNIIVNEANNIVVNAESSNSNDMNSGSSSVRMKSPSSPPVASNGRSSFESPRMKHLQNSLSRELDHATQNSVLL